MDNMGIFRSYDSDTSNYDKYFKELKFLGVNTIRTWATNEHSKKLLDYAYDYDIKVMLGIWMRHGRPGIEDDDSFDYLNDTLGMEQMYENAIQAVRSFKDHPALLTWGIGNEVYLNTETDEEKRAYSIFLEKLCSHIKRIDKKHPITSIEAWTFGIEWWQKYVPSIDIYGLNCYGAGADFLSQEMKKSNVNKPYIVTEFGVTGEWDIKEKLNGIKKEPSDNEKYNTIINGYKNWISNKSNCLGVYVFHYGNGKDFGATWHLSHFNKAIRPQFWAVRETYTGQKPINNVPEIELFKIPQDTARSKTWLPVQLSVNDKEDDKIKVEFYYNQRTGSRKRRNQLLKLEQKGEIKSGLQIQVPEEDGPIKVYVAIYDEYGNVGIESTSIIIFDEDARKRTYLVPKPELPFHVYDDQKILPYVPSGYMGNYQSISLDLENKEDPKHGINAIKISYSDYKGWYGVAFVDPANDWGDILGGYDLTGAKTLSFWAKASYSGVIATIGYGLIEGDKPYPDSSKKSFEFKLTDKWKKYTIKIKKSDMSCIRSGFVLFSSADGFNHDIYLDKIVYQ